MPLDGYYDLSTNINLLATAHVLHRLLKLDSYIIQIGYVIGVALSIDCTVILQNLY